MLGIHPFRLARVRLALRRRHATTGRAPPASAHRGRVCRSTMTCSMLAAVLGQRLVGGGLELDQLAAAVAAIGGDDEARLGILDAIAQRQRGKSAEHHRMDGADARAGVHGDDGLGHQRHVDDDAFAGLLHAQRAQRVGEAADLGMQLPVGQAAYSAILGLEDQREPVARASRGARRGSCTRRSACRR